MRSRCSPLIVMMQPSHFWDFLDHPTLRPLDRPRHRTIHVQRPVCTPVMIILEVLGQKPPEMALVQDDYVVQALATDTPDDSHSIGFSGNVPSHS
jgi:hypothetical protein